MRNDESSELLPGFLFRRFGLISADTHLRTGFFAIRRGEEHKARLNPTEMAVCLLRDIPLSVENTIDRIVLRHSRDGQEITRHKWRNYP